jgi:peptide/nickel transport system substrate-binding protein
MNCLAARFQLRSVALMVVLLALVLGACSPAPTVMPTTAPQSTADPDSTEAPESTEGPAATQPVSEGLSEDRLVPVLDFPFSSAAHDPVRNEIGLLLTQTWEQLGIRVNPMPMDFDGYNAILTSGEGYHAWISGYVSRPERLDPDVLLYQPFHSESENNFSYYSNPEYDAAVDAQRSEMDIQARLEAVHEAQQILARDLPNIALYHVAEVHFYNNRLFENPTPMVGQGLYNVWNLVDIVPLTDQRWMLMGEVESIDTPNPFAETTGANIEFMRLVYDLLARVGPDGSPQPWAAESWEVIDDVTVQVNLRQGMTFHDGEPLTAEDVKFSYDIQKEEGASIYKPFLEPISEVEIVDDHTLIFHLSTPYPALFQATFAQIYLLPQHIWESIPSPRADADNSHPIGSGPFMFETWLVNEEIRLPAFKEHWNAPQVDGLIQVNYANPDALFQGLVNEEIFMHDRRLLPAAIEQAAGYEHLTRVDLTDFGVYYVGFNLSQPPFDSLEFRQAIAHTIDYDTIVNTILAGYGTPGGGFIAPANEFWHDPTVEFPQYDLEAARQILADAGYEWDAEGRLYLPANP